MGLTGHSYGAYETLFIVSQTDSFRAAAPMAGTSICGASAERCTAIDGQKTKKETGKRPIRTSLEKPQHFSGNISPIATIPT